MAGMIHLKDIYDTNGYKFIENLFSGVVYITEKIDGARFAFKLVDGKLIFYKRDSRTPINLIDRTVMKYYETAIGYIESLNPSVIIPDLLYGFEYFADTNPGSIVYDKIPKNNLILTDISDGGAYNTNIDELVKQAKKLNTDPPPIIYKGKLSKTQKEQLIEFLTTDWEELYFKFKTESFTSYIISILNPKLKNTALNIGTSKAIEGFVFSFNDGKTFTNAKVVDPLYTQKARNMAKDKFTPERKLVNDTTKELLRNIISYFKSNIKFDGKFQTDDSESRYIELLSDIFYQYYTKNKGKFRTISTDDKSKEMKMLDINYNFITHKELTKILKSKPNVKTIFKAVLATFGKTRKRGSVTLDTQMVSDVNLLIGKLTKLTEMKPTYIQNMDNMLTEIVMKTN